MIEVKRLVLDVLKPHEPDLLHFARAIAQCGDEYRVDIQVIEIDEKTVTLEVTLEGNDVDLEVVREVIESMGASLHSIDGIEVYNKTDI